MRRLFLLLGVFAFVANAYADDDVSVDLSVLNSLSQAPVAEQSSPRFPVVRNSEAARPAKPRTTPAKARPQAVVPKQTEAVVIPAKIPADPANESIAAEPSVEPATTQPVTSEELAKPSENVKAETESLFDGKQGQTQAGAPTGDDPLATIKPAETGASVINPADGTETPATLQDTQKANQEDTHETPAPAAASTGNQIYFADNDTTLDEVKKSAIDGITAKFSDPVNHKIAIMSYNFDNGEDSFRKKRNSLNRAVEIRSYLLSKGFKNFSIKVINITDDPSKNGLVEIEEIQ